MKIIIKKEDHLEKIERENNKSDKVSSNIWMNSFKCINRAKWTGLLYIFFMSECLLLLIEEEIAFARLNSFAYLFMN